MASTIAAGTTSGTAIAIAGDTRGVLQLQTNGTTAAVTIDTNQRAAFVAGTALLPAITTTGDTNTGIFFPAADTIAFTEGGVESMRIDSSGRVGIGTTSPTTPLQVNGTITATSVNTNNTFGFKNRLINGGMGIDQRNNGAAITINATAVAQFAVDRTSSYGTSSAGVFTAQRSTIAPVGFVNSLASTVTTASTPSGGNEYGIRQTIEGFNIVDLGWGTANAQTVTLSFWVRSSVTGTFAGSVCNDGYNRSYIFTYTINSANTWEYETVTIPGDTTGTWLTDNGAGIRLQLNLGAGSSKTGTAGVWGAGYFQSATGSVNLIATNGATFYTTGWQLEVGSTATSFDYRPYGTELQLCQRYFERWATADQNMVGFCYASNNLNTYNQFLVEKRAAPTLTRYGTFTAYVNGGGNTMTFSSYNAATKAININWTGSGPSAGQAFAWSSGGSPNQLEFNAEYT